MRTWNAQARAAEKVVAEHALGELKVASARHEERATLQKEAADAQLTLVKDHSKDVVALANQRAKELVAAKDETIKVGEAKHKEALEMQKEVTKMIVCQNELNSQRMLQVAGDDDALTAQASM